MRPLFIALLITTLTLTTHAQTSAWKSTTYGKVSLRYPPTWHLARYDRGIQTHISITPDSMKNLLMQMFEVWELPTSAEHNYAFFKANLAPILRNATAPDATVVKKEEISFKGHKCVRTEMLSGSLPTTVYGVDAGTAIYLVVLTPRRYIKIADPGMERDERAILNSITFTPEPLASLSRFPYLVRRMKITLTLLLLTFTLSALATTFTVTTNADSGPGSLRDAITQAAANGTAKPRFPILYRLILSRII